MSDLCLKSFHFVQIKIMKWMHASMNKKKSNFEIDSSFHVWQRQTKTKTNEKPERKKRNVIVRIKIKKMMMMISTSILLLFWHNFFFAFGSIFDCQKKREKERIKQTKIHANEIKKKIFSWCFFYQKKKHKTLLTKPVPFTMIIYI